MYLKSIESKLPQGGYRQLIEALEREGTEVAEILRLFAFKPEAGAHLEQFTQAVMRGPSPLSPGWRELIAAFTSTLNHCPF
jgi:alkylhydroperoxidase family enzyme